MAKFAALLLLSGHLFSAACWAQAPAVRADAIEVRSFLKDTGTLSDPLDESSVLWNVIIANDGSASSSTLVRIELTGPPGSYSNKNSVTLSVTYKGRKVRQQILRKRLGVFSNEGKQFVGFWLPETGCEELTLVARVSSSSSPVSKNIPFTCGE